MRALAKDLAARAITAAHRRVFTLTRGRIAGDLAGMPVLILTTTGRKSSRPRHTMLTTPLQLGDTIVLVASYGGDDRDPQWFRNLQADPRVEVTMRGRTRQMRARVASAEEKARMWDAVTSTYPGYAGYQRRTDRDIPLVLLEPH